LELQNYLIFLRKIKYSVSYPDRVYEPQEISGRDSEYSGIGIEIDGRWIQGITQMGEAKGRM